jgi:peptidoglycan/LPS O-acetylase OafA/YrhL/peroxiredoxin
LSTVSASAAKQPPRKAGHYIELEALRGASAISILILHAYQNTRIPPAGYAYGSNPLVRHLLINLDFGLGVFFALSGFVIFLPFAKAIIEGRPHMGVREFAVRRFFRIVPLYYVAIFVVWNSRYYGGHGQIADLLRHLTFTQIYDNKKLFYTIGPSWSLAVEMHYYVLTGVLIYVLTKVCRRVKSRRTRIALVCAPAVLLALASIWLKAWAYYIQGYHLDNQLGVKHYTIYYSALARADAFAFGMLLAVVVVVLGEWRPRRATLPAILAVAALVPMVVMGWYRADGPNDNPFVALFYYCGVGLCSVLMMGAIVLSKPEWRGMRFLRNRILQFLGVVSFSLYLWHEPMMLMLEKHHILIYKGMPAAWPLTVLAEIAIVAPLSYLSYRLIEVPGQHLRKLLRVRQPQPAVELRRSGELQAARGRSISMLPPLRDEQGEAVELGDLAGGHPVVAFLQPLRHDGRSDQASVAEVRAFREGKFLFDALGVRVIGVSAEPPESQRSLREREQLPFPMLSDPGGAFAAAAGVPVWTDKGGTQFSDRVALLIDRFGTVRDLLGDEIAPPARPSVAAARSEPMLV